MTNERKKPVGLSRRQFGKLAALGASGLVASAVMEGGIPEKVSAEAARMPSWMEKPAPIDEKLISGVHSADIVIIGGGNAGTPAAGSRCSIRPPSGAAVSALPRRWGRYWVNISPGCKPAGSRDGDEFETTAL